VTDARTRRGDGTGVTRHPSLRPDRPVTRVDVARYAGVSTAVVSYVINGGPKPVAPLTAARVRAAIERLDYRPNGNARALRTGTTEMLGLVLSDSTNPYFVELAAAIEAAAAKRAHALIMGNSHCDRALEQQLISDLTRRQVDGIMVAILAQPAYAADPNRVPVPIVWLDSAEPVPGYSSLGSNGHQGAALGVGHLIQRHGHRSVGLLIGDLGTGDVREQGWRDTLWAAGLREGPVARVPWTREGGLEGGLQLLAGPDRPTAVFASSDLQAVGLLRAARELGLSVPGDLAIVSFDGTKESEFSSPPLTVVRQNIEAMAQAAVALAVDREPEPSYHPFDTQLVIRQSCGCDDPGPQLSDRTASGALTASQGGDRG
jgi:LacI family transcriptional regulator